MLEIKLIFWNIAANTSKHSLDYKPLEGRGMSYIIFVSHFALHNSWFAGAPKMLYKSIQKNDLI